MSNENTKEAPTPHPDCPKPLERPYQQFNGIHSSHSSRSSSPSIRPGQIPQSQLPPSLKIPQSQLPPSRSPVTAITHKIGGLNVNQTSSQFGTSSPNLHRPPQFGHNVGISPVVSNTEQKFANSNPSISQNNEFPRSSPVVISSNTNPMQQHSTPSGFQPATTIGLSEKIDNMPAYRNQTSQNEHNTNTYSIYGNTPVQNQQPFISSSNVNLSQGRSNSSNASNPPNMNFRPAAVSQNQQPMLNTNSAFPSQNMPQKYSNNTPATNVVEAGHVTTISSNVPPTTNAALLSQNNQFQLNSNTINSQTTVMPNQPFNSSVPLVVNKMNSAFVGQTQHFSPNPIPNARLMMKNTQPNMIPVQNLKMQSQPVISSAPFSTTAHSNSNLPPPPIKTNIQPPSSSANIQPPPSSANAPFAGNFTVPTNPHYQYSNQQGRADLQTGASRPPPNSFLPPTSVQNQMMAPRTTIPGQSSNANIAGGAPQPHPPQQGPVGYTNGPQFGQPIHKTNLHNNRYPTPVSNNSTLPQPQKTYQQLQNTYPQQQYAGMEQQQQRDAYQQSQYGGVTQTGFNKLWGTDSFDLLQTPNILPPKKMEAPKIRLGQESLDQANCSPDIFRCTITKVPENNSLLQKARLPLGVLIHPFKDLNHLPVIQCNVIVRCRACRTYINPFVFFVDNKRWKCNLCYRINELPEEFQFDPSTKTYGDPSRRPEIKSSTLEYIAPAEYMLRPPQPAVYLFLMDVSRMAIESGYLGYVTTILMEEIKNLPGDARTQIGFIAFDSALHFYSMPEGITQPHEMTILEIDEVFLPTPDNLLVNLKDKIEMVMDLLSQLPNRFINTYDNNSALGAALQVAYKMMSATGGRVTVFQSSLPNVGPGSLTSREDPSQRSQAEVSHLNPANDFYKRLALECSGQQIAVDLFVLNSQYVDMATVSGISRFSGGCIHHFPLFKPGNATLGEQFSRCFKRYLTRKIGFEAVMRIRCTRGLSVHTFHGNFFVRSTDLLSLPNINPDAGFGMQVAIEESLSDVQSVCFQAALLYTSSKGERRIRVHTICLPIASTLQDVIHSADQECIIGLLSKMAVDRSTQSSLSDAREAFINVAIDILSSYKLSLNMASPQSGLLAPKCLSLLPLYISALLKYTAFRVGGSTRLDDRVMAMADMKTKPLYLLLQQIYPDLYPIHELENHPVVINAEEEPVHLPPKLQLSARCLENKGAFLMDTGDHMVIMICPNVSSEFLDGALGVPNYDSIPEDMNELPIIESECNRRLHQFVNYLNYEKPYMATIQIIRDNSGQRVGFIQRLIEDRMENALSYHEFLQHLKTQVK